jgi:NNP family nitrate/nitrite transporter-like MFS transporter
MVAPNPACRPFPLSALLCLSGLLYLNVTGRVIFSPLLPLLESDFRLGHGAAGSLFLFQATGYAVGLLVSGVAAWRLTHHGTIVVSAFGSGVTLLAISSGSSLVALRAGLVLLGAAAGLYLPSGIATITELAADTQRGRAMAVHELAPGIAFITAPLAAEAMLRWVSWRIVLATFGVALLIAGFLYSRAGQGGREGGEPPHLRTMAAMACDGMLARIATLFALAVALGYGLYAMLPLFLVVERGMARPSANTLVGLSRVLGLPMVFAAGWLADRLGHRRALLAFQATTGALTVGLALAPTGVLTGFAVVLQAAASVCFFPPCYSLVTQLVAPARRHLAISVVSIAGMFIGAGLIPSLMGYLAEAWSFAGATLLLGAAALASPGLLMPCAGPARQEKA